MDMMQSQNNIPDAIKKAANDPSLYEMVEKIGNEFALHIDQMGELDAEIRRVLLGLSRSSDFTKNIADLLEIDAEKSRLIAERVNAEIIGVLREKLKSESSAQIQTSVAAMEAIGGFQVEPHTEQRAADSNITTEDKAKILSSLENPTPSKETIVKNEPAKDRETYTEPLIDQLLAGTAARPEEKIVQKQVTTPSKAPENLPTGLPVEKKTASASVPAKKPGIDPYREVVN